jgi:hypothetical protein
LRYLARLGKQPFCGVILDPMNLNFNSELIEETMFLEENWNCALVVPYIKIRVLDPFLNSFPQTNTQPQMDYFAQLPNEIITQIFSYLNIIRFWKLGSTCKRLLGFRDLSNEEWRKKYAHEYYLNENELACYNL